MWGTESVRQKTHQGSDRVGEEDAQMGRGIFFGSSQLRELVDKSGMGLAATTLAEKWEVKMWRGGEIEHVHKMVDETAWVDGGVKWAVVSVGGE